MDTKATELPIKQVLHVGFLKEPIQFAEVIVSQGLHYSSIAMIKVGLLKVKEKLYHVYLPNQIWECDKSLEEYMLVCQQVLNNINTE